MGELFTLERWQVISYKYGEEEAQAQAMLTVKINEKTVHGAADGVGPVDALANVLKKILREFYPEIDEVSLVDYIVHIENSQKGTAAEVKVIIELQKRGQGYLAKAISANILEASWEALVEGFTALLIKEVS